MATMIARASETVLVEGAAGTGKSSYLVDRAVALLEAGTPPSSILILAVSPDAAGVLARRLEEKAGALAQGVTVTVPRDIALQVLDEEHARSRNGRDARILTPFEYNIAMEDLKVSGLRPHRLKEMTKFLFRGWSEMRQDDPDWLINSQERGLVAMLTELAESNRCYFDVEVSGAAVRHLACDGESLAKHTRPCVLVDDFTSLSRASQILAVTLASRLLCAACDPTVRATVFEQYPYAEGANELLERHPNAQRVQLTKSAFPEDTVAAIENVTADAAFLARLELVPAKPGTKGVRALSFDEPDDELDALARLIEEEIEKGRRASDIYVASPSKAWSSRLMRTFRKAGLPHCAKEPATAFGGDVRDLASCQASRLFALLQLQADPSSPAAIRSWCGFGDELTRSAEFDSLRAYCRESDASLSEALGGEAVPPCEMKPEPLSKLRALYDQALKITEDARGLTGNELLSTLARGAADGCVDAMRAAASVAAVCGPIGEADTAEVLLDRAYDRLALPAFPRENAVRIGGLTDAYGLSASLVICSGFVNGFSPSVDYFDRTVVTAEKQALLYRKGLESFHALLCAAPESLAFTHFRSIELSETKRLRVKVDRIRLDKGKRRICLVSPSIYLDRLGGRR